MCVYVCVACVLHVCLGLTLRRVEPTAVIILSRVTEWTDRLSHTQSTPTRLSISLSLCVCVCDFAIFPERF